MNNPKPQRPAIRLAERIAQLSPEQRALFQRKFAGARLHGFDLVARALQQCGITHIYGVAGVPTEQILPACFSRRIRPIGVHHQTAAVCMATAHNYQAGRLVAAALVSPGPAATNAITGLLVARDNGWPVIMLGGWRSSFQKCELLPMLGHVTKHAVDVPSTGSIGECIHRAYEIAVSGRPGPVYLELHEDVLMDRAAASPVRKAGSSKSERPLPSDAEIERIAAALLSARRPALLSGKGVRWSLVPEQLRELIELLGLPFITSPMGRGFVSDDHPLCCNQARTALQSQADVVLILGARLNWVFRHGAELSSDARVFRIDIHPDDEDAAAIRTELVHADAGDFVIRLLDVLKDRHDELADSGRRQRIGDWTAALRAVAGETRRSLDRRINRDQRPMSPYRMMKEIRDALPRNAICITEGNVSMMAAQQVIPAFHPGSRMDAGTNGCMGVGIPFAIGAKLAHPDRPVVAVTGDYGFSLSAMEMEVAVRHGVPIVVVVANNQGYHGAIKQDVYFPGAESERITMFQPGLEYDRMMKMFGGRGATISDPALLKPALENAISATTPYCLNVVVDPDTPLPNAWGEQSPGGGES